MKNILASLVLLTASSMAMAVTGQLFVDGRVDHTSYAPNDAVGKPGYEAWQLNRLKLDYQGKVSDVNLFRVRLDTLQNTAAKKTNGKESAYMDLAYVTHKFTDEVAITMGKIVTGMGGIEGYVNNPGDIYLRSLAGDEVNAIYYPVGAQADLTFGDHKIKVSFANNTADVTGTATVATPYQAGQTAPSTTVGNQTRGLMGASYLGKFNEGNIVATASYHYEDYATTTGTKIKNSYASIGGKFVMDAFEVEADYLANKYDVDAQALNNILATNSAVALFRYKMNEVGSVHLKYEYTDQKVATSAVADTKNKISGITAALEYKPVKDENWRMHLAYTQRDNKPDVGDTKTEKVIIAGMRFYADFLK